ncbi:hypothetical protein AVEN_191963-1 [Araneus ventricosus]|uniref:Uncharacterized protein n=1 Tax=Araneus ventricosus TaxID=182803 RepID=A0A4Y2LA78_ARAVE|nr:hypothetical protein AVEN_191963-1 [Araneus ventricosus]
MADIVHFLSCSRHLNNSLKNTPGLKGLELKAGIKQSGSFHRGITGIRVLDQVAVYQLTGADATKQLLSGHIRSLTFSDNSKCFEMCPKCTAEQATPDHILACLGLSKQDLVSNPLLTSDFFRVYRLMDLI